MFFLIMAAATALGVSQDAAGPTNWDAGDTAVRFVGGTTSPGVRPIGSWTGSASITVRCTVQAEGSLDACEVLSESAPRRLSHSSARANVGKMRLVLGEEGPRAGDTLTMEVVVTRT